MTDGQWAREDVCVDPYLIWRLHTQAEEILLCLFYDNDGAFAAEQSWTGSPSSVTAAPRDLARAAVGHDARYVVMAHNHPSGAPWPSMPDIVATRQLHRLFATLGVTLVDHAIVARDGLVFSFRMAGLV